MEAPPFLPEQVYDFVVVGTGVVEAALAASLASAGKSVAQFDRNGYYGGAWASLSLDAVLALGAPPALCEVFDVSAAEQARAAEQPGWAQLAVDTRRVASPAISGVDVCWSPELAASDEQRAELTQQSRRFNIDLTPAFVFSRGRFVTALVESRVNGYLEFRAVESVMVHHEGALVPVPCSKSAVFAAAFLSPFEKRALMKALKPLLAADPDPSEAGEAGEVAADAEAARVLADWGAQPFMRYLTDVARVSAKLAGLIFNAIALPDFHDSPVTLSTAHAVHAIRAHVGSIGRYGPTAFLATLYGTSEAAQAFSRMAAVLGGVCVLRRCPRSWIVEPQAGELVGVVCTAGQTVRARALICGPDALPDALARRIAPDDAEAFVLSRAVVLARGSLVAEARAALHVIPAGALGNAAHAYVWQLDDAAQAAPPGYVVYNVGTARSAVHVSARADLERLVRGLFRIAGESAGQATAATATATADGDAPDVQDDERPLALLVVYFSQQLNCFAAADGAAVPSNVTVLSSARLLSLDACLLAAEAAFARLCPGERFLAPLPTPDEVAWPEPGAGNADPADPADPADRAQGPEPEADAGAGVD